MKYYERRIFKYIKEIMVELSFDNLCLDDISEYKRFNDYNFDYIQLIDIVLCLEKKLMMEFTTSCIDVIYMDQTIYDFVKLITEEYTLDLYKKIKLENTVC